MSAEPITERGAIERARALWGGALEPPAPTGAGWVFRRIGDPTVHALDSHGRVACGHPACLALEGRAGMNAIADRRVRLHRVFQTKLGLPDRIEVTDPAGRLLASITATEGAIEIAGTRGAGLSSEPGRESGPAGRLASLRVNFHP